MDPYILVLTGFGVVVLLTAWLPMVLRELPLSLPIVCVGLGAALFAFPGAEGPAPSPLDHRAITERLTELVVIVALMGAGLKLDRALDRVSGAMTVRLLAIAMPLTIAAIALAGSLVLGLGLGASLLLGAVLAPTDPVLASDVQVGAPGEGKEDDVRFTLTAEAGLNDGLAFPFVHLAIAVTVSGGLAWPVLGEWLAVGVAWKLLVGAGAGWICGRCLGWLTFRLPKGTRLSRTGDGFVALGITAVTYGLTEIIYGYGFLAVFVAAVTFRSVERNHGYHETLHDFVNQLERLLMMVLLVLFGASIVGGGLLGRVDGVVVLFTAIAIFAVRPLAAWISLLGRNEPAGERWVVSFFGIRGLGSAYYLAFALGEARFEQPDLLWSAVGFTVLISIILHGVTVTPVMRRLDNRRD